MLSGKIRAGVSNYNIIKLRALQFLAIAMAIPISSCIAITSSTNSQLEYFTVKQAEIVYSLPRTVFNLNVGKDGIQVSKGAEADPDALISAHFELSAFADDTISAQVSEEGLLVKLSSTSADKTGEIAVNVAKLVFTLGTGGASPSSIRALPSSSLGNNSFSASYDPLDPGESWAVRPELAKAGFCILVGAEVSAGPRICSEKISPADLNGPQPPANDVKIVEYSKRNPGIYYRQPRPTPVEIYRRSGKKWKAVFVGNETLFDKFRAYQIVIDRAAFVEKKIELTFTGGALTKVDITKPSEVLALSTAGLEIAKIILAIPAQAFNQRAGLIDAETKLLNAETSRIDAENKLLKLRAEQVLNSQGAQPVRSLVNFQYAGIRSNSSVRSLPGSLALCQTSLAANVAQCRTLIESGGDGQ